MLKALVRDQTGDIYCRDDGAGRAGQNGDHDESEKASKAAAKALKKKRQKEKRCPALSFQPCPSCCVECARYMSCLILDRWRTKQDSLAVDSTHLAHQRHTWCLIMCVGQKTCNVVNPAEAYRTGSICWLRQTNCWL